MRVNVNQKLINKAKIENQDINYLVFAGGGAKGLVYTGVDAALIDFIIGKVKSISGSSIGSINAAFLATGISRDKYYEDSKKIMVQKLFGTQYFFNKDGTPVLEYISSTIKDNISQYFNQNPNTEEATEIQKKITNSLDITFKDLHELKQIAPETFKDLIITAVREDSGELEIFDYKNSPDLSIAKACRASMSLPLLFEPYKINDVTYVDGGIVDLVPIEPFENKDGRIMAFDFGYYNNVNRAIYCMENPIVLYNSFNYLSDVIMKHFFGDKNSKFKKDKEHTYQMVRSHSLDVVVLDTANISTLSFDEAQDESQYLYLKGYAQTMNYLRNHNFLPKKYDYNMLDVKNLIIGVCEEYFKKSPLESIIDNIYSIVNYIIYEFSYIDLTKPNIKANEVLNFASEEYCASKSSEEVLLNFVKNILIKKDEHLIINTQFLDRLITILNDPYTPSTLKGQVISIVKSNKIDTNSETIEKDLINLKFDRQDFTEILKKDSCSLENPYKKGSFSKKIYVYEEYFKNFLVQAEKTFYETCNLFKELSNNFSDFLSQEESKTCIYQEEYNVQIIKEQNHSTELEL